MRDGTLDFSHPNSFDGKMDSVCAVCFRIVSTHSCHSDIALAEQSHICNEVIQRIILEAWDRSGQALTDPDEPDAISVTLH
jgi:hypothetical protein